jgi:hypothetical protein
MTTSNITDAIDLAFVDRADIKQYIAPPAPLMLLLHIGVKMTVLQVHWAPRSARALRHFENVC